MTPPGASANNQQAEPTPHDLADAPEQPIPATREAALPESATQIAPSASRFEIVPAFSAIRTDLGLQSAISKMIAAQDLGLSKIISQQAALPKLSAVTIGNLAASLAVSSVNLTGMSAAASLADLLLRWREVAESGVGVLRGLARAAYKAALRARSAVLRGDDDPVAWFISTWLGLRVSPERIEAVSAALLEEGWDAGIRDDPAYLITDLRKRTVRQGRVLRPIWETQLNYRTVGMLDEPVRTSNGALLTVADLVPGAKPAEDLVLAGEWEEQRLRHVLGRLKPDELRVTNVYAQRSELSWAEAARIAGAADPAAAGERIRRKLKRLGAEEERRVALRSSLP